MIAACSQGMPVHTGSFNAASNQAGNLERLPAVEHLHPRYARSASVMLCCHGYYRQVRFVTTACMYNPAPLLYRPALTLHQTPNRCEAYRQTHKQKPVDSC